MAAVRLKEDGRVVRVHVKNTGRCRELLVPGAEVILEDFRGRMGSRKMEYSLIAVYKGDLLINMDSQAPNIVMGEMLKEGKIRLPGLKYQLSLIKPEAKFGDSRLDFYVEDAESDKAFIEVKGVTLEEDGIVKFPDAPTERGTKHLKELVKAAGKGYGAYVVFVVQMDRAERFEPNDATDPAFAEAFHYACGHGVQALAFTCRVGEDGMTIDRPLDL